MKRFCKHGHDTATYGRDANGVCSVCRKIYGLRFNKEHPERAREAQLKSLFGVTPERYTELLMKQKYSCAGCGKHQLELSKSLCVDHDHQCCPGKKSCGNCVRGLLCVSCNLVLGYSKDSSRVLTNLILYLEK